MLYANRAGDGVRCASKIASKGAIVARTNSEMSRWLWFFGGAAAVIAAGLVKISLIRR
jgi:hypothetical protein